MQMWFPKNANKLTVHSLSHVFLIGKALYVLEPLQRGG